MSSWLVYLLSIAICVIDYHKFSSLKYHTCIIAQFLEGQAWLKWILCSDSQEAAVQVLSSMHSVNKKGLHSKPNKLRGGLHDPFTNLETWSNHTGRSETKDWLTKSRSWWAVIVLGWNLPWQKSIFNIGEPVCCLCASMITYLWNVKVTSLFANPVGTTTRAETTNPLIVIVTVLIVDC